MRRDLTAIRRRFHSWRGSVWLALWVFGLLGHSGLAEGAEGQGDAVASLRITPAQAHLRGPDSVQQLAVEGLPAGSEATDLTPSAVYESSDPRVAGARMVK